LLHSLVVMLMSDIPPTLNLKYGRYRLWRGGLPSRSDFEPVKVLVEEFDHFPTGSVQDASYAAVKTRSSGMYGLLGASFIPGEDITLRIEVGSSGGDPYVPRQGLNERFALSVMDLMIRLATIESNELSALGAGTLRFDHANQHPVESSRRGFQRLALIVLWLLNPLNRTLSQEELLEAFAELRLP